MDSPPTSNAAGASERSLSEEQSSPGSSQNPPSSPRVHSWYQFWDKQGTQRQDAPREWTPALLEICVRVVDWTALRLLRNGTELPVRQVRFGEKVRTVVPWPRSGPGHYELHLKGPSIQRQETVSIWPEKITRAEYSQLLEDLETRLPVQVAVALKETGGLAGIELTQREETTLDQELVRLRRAVRGTDDRPGLARILRKLAGRHHRILTSEERWVRRGKARRPPGDRLGQAFARPGNVEDEMLKEVPDTRTRHTPDVYENQVVAQFARQVNLRLRRIIPALPERGNGSADEAEDLLNSLDGALQEASFLREVSDLKHPPTRASMVLQKRPLYRAALEGYLEFQKSISVTLDAPELEAPLKNLPFLYQLWCTLQVFHSILQETAGRGFRTRRSSLFRRKGGFLTLSLAGAGLHLYHPESGVRIDVLTERTYGSQPGGTLHSVSFAQRPDIAIEVTYPSGQQRVYLLDPKYKLEPDSNGESSNGDDEVPGRATKRDLDKMHAYRDAIRDGQGNRVVNYAAILYPGETKRYSDGLGAIGVRPDHTRSLRKTIGQLFDREVTSAVEQE